MYASKPIENPDFQRIGIHIVTNAFSFFTTTIQICALNSPGYCKRQI
jgi:hypothetical protein